MNEHLQELTIYIQQQLSQGISESNLRQTLKQYNWDDQLVDAAFQTLTQQTSYGTPQLQTTATGPQPTRSEAGQTQSIYLLTGRQMLNAVLWIISPLIVLLVAIIINIVVGSLSEESTALKTAATIISGIGIVMLVLGPSVGIFKLYKRRHK